MDALMCHWKKFSKTNRNMWRIKMIRRLITVIMMVLAVVVFTSGCYTKKGGGAKGKTGTEAYNQGNIIGYDANGNPIYGDIGSMGDYRIDGAPVNAPQFESVYFDYDSPQIAYSEQAKLEPIVAYLQQNPTFGVVVEGNCDERGSNEYNLALGERRALAVRAAMISRGIDGSRIQTKSYGEERPVAFGHDEASWRLNRRADFIFIQL